MAAAAGILLLAAAAPGAAQERHTVQPGDSLASIAQGADLPGWQAVYQANEQRIGDPDVLLVGQQLRVPDARADDGGGRARPAGVISTLLDAAGGRGAGEAPLPAPAQPDQQEQNQQQAEQQAAEQQAAEQQQAEQEQAEQEQAEQEQAEQETGGQAPGSGVWTQLAECESNGRWHLDSTYDGGLQFAPETWRAFGGGQYAPTADEATPGQQIAIGQKVQAAQGWGAWPACADALGLT